MVPPLDIGRILSWLILIIAFVVAAYYIGLNLGKKLRGRYLVAISLIYWIVALVVFYALSVLSPFHPLYNLVTLFLHPLIFSNVILDIAFMAGHSRQKPSS